jgi:hypothetical protein
VESFLRVRRESRPFRIVGDEPQYASGHRGRIGDYRYN